MADSTFSTFSKRLWNVLSCLLVSSKTIYGLVSVGIHAALKKYHGGLDMGVFSHFWSHSRIAPLVAWYQPQSRGTLNLPA